MKVTKYLGLCLMVFCLSATGPLRAEILDSRAGVGICVFNAAGTACSKTVKFVAINPNEQWQANGPLNPGDASDRSAVWISFQNTGWKAPQPGFEPSRGTIPVFRLTERFVTGPEGYLSLHIWADDTAGVWLDGALLIPPLFTQTTCSGDPIGCLPEDLARLNLALSAGAHVLSFDVYQVGTGRDNTSNPMGLLYTGTVTGTVPEPTAVLLTALMGSLALGVGVFRKRV
jgi:hypothetical protein